MTDKKLIEQIDRLLIPNNSVAFWSLGQMGFAIKGDDDHVIYIDPILSNIVAERTPEHAEIFTRSYPPPLKPEDVTNANYVLITHEHMDHADPQTLGPISKASPQAKFITSKWTSEALKECNIPSEKYITPSIESPLDLGFLKVWVIPAAHYDIEYDSDLGYRYMGYIIKWNHITIYHSGDTLIYPGYIEHLKTLPSIDIALVAMNGRDAYRESLGILGNLYPNEAVWLAKKLEWDVLICGHNDLFEANSIDPCELMHAVQKLNPRQKHHSLQPGEMFFYHK